MNRLIDIVVSTGAEGVEVQFCREGRGTKTYHPSLRTILFRLMPAIFTEQFRGRIKICLYSWGWSAWRVTEEGTT